MVKLEQKHLSANKHGEIRAKKCSILGGTGFAVAVAVAIAVAILAGRHWPSLVS